VSSLTAVPGARADPSAPAAGRLDSLTALRFFAAFFVVVFHSWYIFTGRQGLDGAGFVNFGYTSVGFFFVLSGFVLAWSWRPGIPVVQLWWRRVARIFPLCALLTTTVALYFWLVPLHAPVGMPNWDSYLRCIFLLQAWAPFTHLSSYNYPSWSLSTELFFYLCFPFVAIAAARIPRRLLVPLALLFGVAYVVAAWWVADQMFYSYTPGSLLAYPPLQLAKFTVGVLLGTAFRRGWRPRVSMLFALALVVAAYAGMVRMVQWDGPMFVFRQTELFPDFVVLLPLTYLIVAAASLDLRGGIALGRVRPLVVLGDWSFALYLVHAPLLMLVNEIRLGTGHVAPEGFDYMALYIAVAVLASGVLHVGFERPVERQLRKLVRSRRRGAHVAVPFSGKPAATGVTTDPDAAPSNAS
jgi:peptidoglycan/LPS O-acetylase OafA/YrhL